MSKGIDVIATKVSSGLELDEYERRECAWGNVGKYITEIEGEDHRWTREMQTIFKIGEQYYAIDWMRGLTEMQDNEYWDDPYKVERKEEVVTATIVSYTPVEE